MDAVISENKVRALDFVEELLQWAWESVDIEDVQEKYGIDEGGALSFMYYLGTMDIEMSWNEDEEEDEEILVGEPDFTFIDEDYECCMATDGRWSCTRLDGHSGQHAAGDGDDICAVWE